ncbi:D-sedoheptulose-7-phosphate isomerase [Xylanimonas protaetiae]|uniref:SIS domain-containing protein n=1 Tax=Xylanimonas protaetiae TaxID=2509457 RepID=A0A4P6FA59_9MICO|nr:SIS domain-containing protein [Xylanimonas protaetiae]QAY71169.1 SIS domain-containing protein [Xylanimonas protaetiae]
MSVARWLEDHDHDLRFALYDLRGQTATIDRWGRLLADRLTHGHRLLAVGNGGSAAQAQHLTAELVGRFDGDRRPLAGVCLSAETSSLTAIVNDYGVDEMFARQVEAHGRPGDVLVALSTSGRSPNVLRAAERARECGVLVWGLVGPLPNPLAARCDDALVVAAPNTATVQAVHLVALHAVCAALDEALGATAGVAAVAEVPA